MMKMSLSALALAAAFATSGSAATVSFTAVGASGNPVGQGTDIGAATWLTSPATVSGSVGGQYRSPYDNAELEYFTVGSPGQQGSPAVLLLNSVKNTFSMLWGSIDTYNAVTFCLGETCDTISGSEIKAASSVPFATGNAVVNFTSDFYFDTVSFYSNFGRVGDAPAFEFALAPVPVPLPAGGLLLLGALGGIAALRRRKAAV
jgi:hypothetical protein